MKQKLLLKTMLLLCALVAGSSSVWAAPTELISWSRSGTTDTYTTGYTFSPSEKASAKSGYYQDSGTTGTSVISLSLYHTTNKLFSTAPTSVSFKAKLGAGATRDQLGNNVKVCFVDKDGNDIAESSVDVTSKITNKDGSDFTVSMSTSKATSAYGIKIYHTKEDSWNVRYYSFSLSYEAPTSTSKASTPTFNPISTTVLTKAQNITVSSTNAVKIIYTTNGDEPTVGGATTSTINAASGSIMVAGSGTISVKANGVDDEDVLTDLSTATYTIKPVNPVILPTESTYETTTNVSFTQEDDVDIYYTLDGTTPTSSSTKYNGTPFAITENLTIKAIAIDTYGNQSDVVEANYKNSELQATEIEITNWNTVFGTSFNGQISGDNRKDYEGTIENVTIVYKEAENMYMKNDDLRIYNGSALQFTAPAGYAFTEVAFSGTTSSDKAPSADYGTFSYSTKKWTGLAPSFTLSRDSGTGYTKFTSATIKLVRVLPVTITAATWASFSCDKALDFTNTDVKAYIAKAKDDSNVTLTEIKKVPASTGIVVNAPAGTYPIPVLSGDADETTGNLLKPWLTAGTPTESKYYTLAVDNDKKPMFKVSSGGTLAAGKSYLVVSGSGAPTLAVDFGETTGVNTLNVERGTLNGEVYNLNGQRVAQLTKGLYIVNGKKVLIK